MTFQSVDRVEFDKSLQKPNLLGENLLASAYTGESRIPFCKEDEARLAEIYRTNTVVSSLVQYIVRYIFKSGISIKMSSPNSDYVIGRESALSKANDNENFNVKYWRDYELQPTMEQIFIEWLVYGYACVTIVRSRVFPEWKTILLLPKNKIEVYQNYAPYKLPEYKVFWKTTTGGQMLNSSPIKNSAVLCMFPPTPEGRLDSPIARCMETIAEIEALRQYQLTAFYRAAETPFIWTSTDTASARQVMHGPEGIIDSARTSEYIGPGTESYTMVKARVQNSIESALDEERANSIWYRNKLREMRGVDRPYIPDIIRRVEAVDPILEAHIAPPGRVLQKPPDTRLPADVTKLIEEGNKRIYAALGMPASLDQLVSDNVKSVDVNDRRQRDSIQYFQERSKPLFVAFLVQVMSKTILKEVYNREILPDDTVNKNPTAIAKIKSEINIELTYNHTPFMTAEALIMQYESGVLKPEAFQKMSCMVNGVPEEYIRPDMETFLKKKAEWGKPPKQPTATKSKTSKTTKKKQRTK